MVYLRDIAAILGVSVSTVGKALKGYPDISEETRRRVIRTAEDIGYRADGDRDRRAHDWSCQEPGPERRTERETERGTRQETERRTGAIGVLAPDMGKLLESDCYKEILCAMAAEAVVRGRDLVILGADIKTVEEEGLRAEKGLTGICLLMEGEHQVNNSFANRIECGIPIVSIGADAAESPDEIGRAAVRELLRIAEHPERN